MRQNLGCLLHQTRFVDFDFHTTVFENFCDFYPITKFNIANVCGQCSAWQNVQNETLFKGFVVNFKGKGFG